MTDKERDAMLELAKEVNDLRKANLALCGAVIILGLLLTAHMLGVV